MLLLINASPRLMGLCLVLLFTTALNGQNPSTSCLHLADQIIGDGKLIGLEESTWKFIDQANSSAVNSGQVVRWGNWRGVVDRPAVWLDDGSWLVGDLAFNADQRVMVQNRWLNVPSIPLRSVRGVVLTPVASLTEWIGRQQSLYTAEGEGDIVWLKDQRRLVGVIDWTSLESNTQLKVNIAGQNVTIPLEEVVALLSSPALLGAPSTPSVRIGLSDGTLLHVNEVKAVENRVAFSLSSLPQLGSIDLAQDFTAAITLLSYSNVDKVQRLDQLKPISYRHVSDNQLEFALGNGRDVYGNPLQFGRRRQAGIVFSGLALHSSAQAAYRWDSSPGKFLAEVRLAPSVGKIGSVVCKVLLARHGNLQNVSEFSLRADDHSASQLVEIDISDAQLVALVVEKADRNQIGDHVFWLDARFVTP